MVGSFLLFKHATWEDDFNYICFKMGPSGANREEANRVKITITKVLRKK